MSDAQSKIVWFKLRPQFWAESEKFEFKIPFEQISKASGYVIFEFRKNYKLWLKNLKIIWDLLHLALFDYFLDLLEMISLGKRFIEKN